MSSPVPLPTQPTATTAAVDVKSVDPSNPEISPSVIPWKSYKNDAFTNRGFTVAPQDWKEWSDLPAPYKYLGVKVNPAHVENHGAVWKFFSDWKTAVPASILFTVGARGGAAGDDEGGV